MKTTASETPGTEARKRGGPLLQNGDHLEGASLLKVARAGTQTDAHAAFVEQLERRRTEENGG